jgi:uncharacterized protein
MTAEGTGLKRRLEAAMKTALKAGEKKKLGAVRLILAAIKQVEIDDRTELDDQGIITVLDKMVKQRRDSARQYRDAGRTDLAEVEEFEIAVIQEYLPKPLTPEEIQQMIKSAVEESGTDSVKGMGKVMGLLKPRMQGRADMAAVAQEVKKFLSNP